MTHLPQLISDLGVILAVAAIVTLVFRYLKQPVILGYIIAGFLVSRHVPFMPTVDDTESIKIWAEIGVIFLLFGLGLEFSFKKLMVVGKSASIAATVEVVCMLAIGYLAGQMFGWTKMDSLFLGGILSISSTTIIVRAFDELGLKGKKFVQLVFGILIVEDLFAVLLLVLLSTVAVTQSLSGVELASSTLRLGFFLILWFLIGIYILPRFLNKVRELLTDETALIVSIGLCLMMVMLATKLGFSPALGAFIMGSLLAETRDGKRIEHLIVPVRDLFAAIFFVSVGMLINPQVILDYWWIIFIVTILTIIGKFLSTGLGGLLSGQSLSVSVQSGMSLAQIGEFSFIIATLGLSLGVTSDFLYPVAVSVSAISTFTTPYMIKYSHPFYLWLSNKIPSHFIEHFGKYRSSLYGSSNRSSLNLLWNAYGVKGLLNTVIVIAITLAMSQVLLPYISKQFDGYFLVTPFVALLALLLSSPFLWALNFSGPANPEELGADEVTRLQGLQFGFSLFRSCATIILLVFFVNQFSSVIALSGLLLLLAALLIVLFSPLAEPFYSSVEKKFIDNLEDKEKVSLLSRNNKPNLAPWDASLAELVISPSSSICGKTLQDKALKERFGVIVAMIERGSHRILVPRKEEVLFPYDRLYIIGTDEQLDAAREMIESKELPSNIENGEIGLESFIIDSESPFINQGIRESGIREKFNGIIVGIERNGRRILNPESTLLLEPNDLIWAVGDVRLIRTLRNEHGEKKN